MAKEIFKIRYHRLRMLVQTRFRSQTEFARKVGKSATYINFLLNDPELEHHKNLGEDLARQFEKELGLPTGWLDRENDDDVPLTGNVIPIGEREHRGYVMIPRKLVNLAAGDGEIVFHEENAPPLAFREEWLSKRKLKPESLVVAYASGDSMTPRIHDGDTLLIDTSEIKLRDNAIYAIRLGDELKVKRIFKRFGSIVISSDNPRYLPQELSDDKAEELHIIGRVVWVSGSI